MMAGKGAAVVLSVAVAAAVGVVLGHSLPGGIAIALAALIAGHAGAWALGRLAHPGSTLPAALAVAALAGEGTMIALLAAAMHQLWDPSRATAESAIVVGVVVATFDVGRTIRARRSAGTGARAEPNVRRRWPLRSHPGRPGAS